MSSYESRIPHFVEGKNEDEVRAQLVKLGMDMGQKVEIASIYFNASRGRVVAWYFHDTKSNAPVPPIKKAKKKTSKKKATKKA